MGQLRGRVCIRWDASGIAAHLLAFHGIDGLAVLSLRANEVPGEEADGVALDELICHSATYTASQPPWPRQFAGGAQSLREALVGSQAQGV